MSGGAALLSASSTPAERLAALPGLMRRVAAALAGVPDGLIEDGGALHVSRAGWDAVALELGVSPVVGLPMFLRGDGLEGDVIVRASVVGLLGGPVTACATASNSERGRAADSLAQLVHLAGARASCAALQAAFGFLLPPFDDAAPARAPAAAEVGPDPGFAAFLDSAVPTRRGKHRKVYAPHGRDDGVWWGASYDGGIWGGWGRCGLSALTRANSVHTHSEESAARAAYGHFCRTLGLDGGVLAGGGDG